MSLYGGDVETVVQTTSSPIEHREIRNENVEVSSWISDDCQTRVDLNVGSEKFQHLIANLSQTHSQLDEYVQQRTKLISGETQKIIEKILEETKEQQRRLLFEIQGKSQQLEDQYQRDLQARIHLLNEDKAEQLVQLEKALNDEQQLILDNAREQIDLLQRRANELKMNLLAQAQQLTNEHVQQITEEVVLIGQEDSAQRLASSSTTVITTQSIAQSVEPTLSYAAVVTQS